MQTVVPSELRGVINADEWEAKLSKADRADIWARKYIRRTGAAPKIDSIVTGIREEDARRRGLPVGKVKRISRETARQGLVLALLWRDTHCHEAADANERATPQPG